MHSQKRKQKKVVQKQFQDDIKQVKNSLNDAKAIIERANGDDDYWQALQILNKAIMRASSVQVTNSYLLYYYRGFCYLNLKQLEKAERDFIQASSLADQKGKIQIYNCLGRCKVEMADQDPTYLEQGIKCYQKAIQYSKNTDGQAYLKLASIYRRLKNNYQAIKYYTCSLKYLKMSQQFQAYTDRGLCYRQIGQIQNSIQDFGKACELRKQDASSYFNLGVNYLLNLKYETGLQKFDIAIQLNPTEPQYKNYKGLALYLNGQYQNCLHVYRETLKLYHDKNISNSQVGECWYNLGNALLHLNQQDQAITAFNMGLDFDIKQDQRLKIYYAQGLAYQSKKSIQAIDKFKLSLSLIGQNKSNDLYLSTLYHLAINEHQHKKYLQATRDINRIVEEGCSQKCVYELRGRVHLDDQKYQLALKDFQTLLSLDASYPEVYYYLGMSKANLGQIDAAIADFFKAVDLGSKNPSIMNGISFAHLKAGRPEKSLVYINIALERQPNNQSFLTQRSMVYLQLGQNTKSIQDLTKALTINGKNSFTYYRRGLSYYKNKQFQQAINNLSLSLENDPSQQIEHDIYYLIGVSYANKQDFQSAVKPFSKAIQLKKIPKYYHERAKCYIMLERNSEALQDLNQVINDQPNNAFAYFRRALAYKALKMYEQSAQNFMKARDLSPDDPKLIVNKKQIYEIKFRKLCQPGQEL